MSESNGGFVVICFQCDEPGYNKPPGPAVSQGRNDVKDFSSSGDHAYESESASQYA
jgi:hypothetical protein